MNEEERFIELVDLARESAAAIGGLLVEYCNDVTNEVDLLKSYLKEVRKMTNREVQS